MELHSPPAANESVAVIFAGLLSRGRLRVDFYGEDRAKMESRGLGPGKVILLISGGHCFEVIEEIEMVEVKQGSYAGEMDKMPFPGITASVARFDRGTRQKP